MTRNEATKLLDGLNEKMNSLQTKVLGIQLASQNILQHEIPELVNEMQNILTNIKSDEPDEKVVNEETQTN